MNASFADSYFFIALLFENDEAHAQAQDIAARLSTPLYTTMWVLLEVADALAVPGRRQTFRPFLQLLRANELMTIIPFDEKLFERGVALYDQRPDKSWSLTDCISFLVMEDHGLRDALTGDHHFEQAGFRALMKQ